MIRNILGADPNSGAVAIGGFPRVGQTLQYQLRDRNAADAEWRAVLRGAAAESGRSPLASLLFACSGRGSRLFGSKSHDAGLLEEILGRTTRARDFFAMGRSVRLVVATIFIATARQAHCSSRGGAGKVTGSGSFRLVSIKIRPLPPRQDLFRLAAASFPARQTCPRPRPKPPGLRRWGLSAASPWRGNRWAANQVR